MRISHRPWESVPYQNLILLTRDGIKTPRHNRVAGAGSGQEYFSCRRKKNFTTLARGFLLLNETTLRLAIPDEKCAGTFLPATEKPPCGGYSVAGAGIAPATSRLCIPLRLSPPPMTRRSSWSGLCLHPSIFGIGCLPSSLYTFLDHTIGAWLGIIIHLREKTSPNLAGVPLHITAR